MKKQLLLFSNGGSQGRRRSVVHKRNDRGREVYGKRQKKKEAAAAGPPPMIYPSKRRRREARKNGGPTYIITNDSVEKSTAAAAAGAPSLTVSSSVTTLSQQQNRSRCIVAGRSVAAGAATAAAKSRRLHRLQSRYYAEGVVIPAAQKASEATAAAAAVSTTNTARRGAFPPHPHVLSLDTTITNKGTKRKLMSSYISSSTGAESSMSSLFGTSSTTCSSQSAPVPPHHPTAAATAAATSATKSSSQSFEGPSSVASFPSSFSTSARSSCSSLSAYADHQFSSCCNSPDSLRISASASSAAVADPAVASTERRVTTNGGIIAAGVKAASSGASTATFLNSSHALPALPKRWVSQNAASATSIKKRAAPAPHGVGSSAKNICVSTVNISTALALTVAHTKGRKKMKGPTGPFLPAASEEASDYGSSARRVNITSSTGRSTTAASVVKTRTDSNSCSHNEITTGNYRNSNNSSSTTTIRNVSSQSSSSSSSSSKRYTPSHMNKCRRDASKLSKENVGYGHAQNNSISLPGAESGRKDMQSRRKETWSSKRTTRGTLSNTAGCWAEDGGSSTRHSQHERDLLYIVDHLSKSNIGTRQPQRSSSEVTSTVAASNAAASNDAHFRTTDAGSGDSISATWCMAAAAWAAAADALPTRGEHSENASGTGTSVLTEQFCGSTMAGRLRRGTRNSTGVRSSIIKGSSTCTLGELSNGRSSAVSLQNSSSRTLTNGFLSDIRGERGVRDDGVHSDRIKDVGVAERAADEERNAREVGHSRGGLQPAKRGKARRPLKRQIGFRERCCVYCYSAGHNSSDCPHKNVVCCSWCRQWGHDACSDTSVCTAYEVERSLRGDEDPIIKAFIAQKKRQKEEKEGKQLPEIQLNGGSHQQQMSASLNRQREEGRRGSQQMSLLGSQYSAATAVNGCDANEDGRKAKASIVSEYIPVRCLRCGVRGHANCQQLPVALDESLGGQSGSGEAATLRTGFNIRGALTVCQDSVCWKCGDLGHRGDACTTVLPPDACKLVTPPLRRMWSSRAPFRQRNGERYLNNHRFSQQHSRFGTREQGSFRRAPRACG